MNLPHISTEALQVFTGEEAFYYRLVPYLLEGNVLSCMSDSSLDYSVHLDEIANIYGFSVVLNPIDSGELDRLMGTRYRSTGASGNNIRIQASGCGNNLIEEIIYEAYGLRASDIHIEPCENRCRVRFRIDGHLLERHIIPKNDYPGVVNRIKIMSSLDISEKRLPQDGRIMYSNGAVKFDIRVSVLPSIYGEKIVLRLLSGDGFRLSLEELGFEQKQYDDYIASISSPHGLILISGPTGSGKTTTLYATLERLNRGDNNILTIEDPVEYTLDGVNQVQLKEDIGLTFPVALRTFLRQDPDIIMLGEIRDEATAEMAVRSSLTGHLLLSTLHTNSAWGCIARLTDMGIHPYLLSETLIACVAQRLVRVLCPHCRRPVSVPSDILRGLGLDLEYDYNGSVGCPLCHYTGYYGRKAVYEVIRMNRKLVDAVRNGLRDVNACLAESGVITLRDSALSLLLAGETSLEEVMPLLNEMI
ncbi:MAG: GspE/PulE family protein [Bacteroidales bacterium]|nr:GspE/PulE family protein [Bacteroidales bacterium]MDE7126700.1 GspE/PulE family protein [Bacteroidales bacterium]